MRPPCTGVILDTVKSWIGTGTASPASSSKVPSRSAVSSGGGARVSTRSMWVVRNVQTLRTTHISWEQFVGPGLRRRRLRQLGCRLILVRALAVMTSNMPGFHTNSLVWNPATGYPSTRSGLWWISGGPWSLR